MKCCLWSRKKSNKLLTRLHFFEIKNFCGHTLTERARAVLWFESFRVRQGVVTLFHTNTIPPFSFFWKKIRFWVWGCPSPPSLPVESVFFFSFLREGSGKSFGGILETHHPANILATIKKGVKPLRTKEKQQPQHQDEEWHEVEAQLEKKVKNGQQVNMEAERREHNGEEQLRKNGAQKQHARTGTRTVPVEENRDAEERHGGAGQRSDAEDKHIGGTEEQ